MKCILSLVALVAACCACANAAKREVKTVRLLTVGNSFSGNATSYLDELAAAAGHKLVLGRADLGGCSLERHWKAVEADPKSDAGRPYTVRVGEANRQRSLEGILASEKWDFVTIQQYSLISPDVTTYRPYARNLFDFIKKHAPQAEVLIHETWAYRRDDPGFESGASSQVRMYRDLSRAYRAIAKELGLSIIPVGDAFYAADTDDTWRYRPAKLDQSALKHSDLPDQTHSLHVGWHWVKDDEGSHRLAMDGHHASAAGCYLAGCVWFEVLFNESVENNPFVPAGMLQADAAYLRSLAHRIARTEL